MKSSSNVSFVVGNKYYYGYDSLQYLCLYMDSVVVLFRYEYQGLVRHCLKQVAELNYSEWSTDPKVRKRTLSSLYMILVAKTEAASNYLHRRDDGDDFNSTDIIQKYSYLAGQGVGYEDE